MIVADENANTCSRVVAQIFVQRSANKKCTWIKCKLYVPAGDLLREERNQPDSEYGELIEGHIRNGTIVPVEITCALLEAAMNKSEKNDFLIDGFPR